MNPLTLQLSPAVAGLVAAAVDGANRSVYVEVSPTDGAHLGWECLWADGRKAIFVRARHGQAGLIVEVRVEEAPPPVAAVVAA